jgi:hypothetical protein
MPAAPGRSSHFVIALFVINSMAAVQSDAPPTRGYESADLGRHHLRRLKLPQRSPDQRIGGAEIKPSLRQSDGGPLQWFGGLRRAAVLRPCGNFNGWGT